MFQRDVILAKDLIDRRKEIAERLSTIEKEVERLLLEDAVLSGLLKQYERIEIIEPPSDSEQLANLSDTLVGDIMEASDEQILAEAEEEFGSVEKAATHVQELINLAKSGVS